MESAPPTMPSSLVTASRGSKEGYVKRRSDVTKTRATTLECAKSVATTSTASALSDSPENTATTSASMSTQSEWNAEFPTSVLISLGWSSLCAPLATAPPVLEMVIVTRNAIWFNATLTEVTAPVARSHSPSAHSTVLMSSTMGCVTRNAIERSVCLMDSTASRAVFGARLEFESIAPPTLPMDIATWNVTLKHVDSMEETVTQSPSMPSFWAIFESSLTWIQSSSKTLAGKHWWNWALTWTWLCESKMTRKGQWCSSGMVVRNLTGSKWIRRVWSHTSRRSLQGRRISLLSPTWRSLRSTRELDSSPAPRVSWTWLVLTWLKIT